MDAFIPEMIQRNGKKIHIKYEYCETRGDMSPREWDNLGRMICFHKNYQLGDSHAYKAPDKFISFLERVSKKTGVVQLPLYLMDHSGLTINTTGFAFCDPQGWDWGEIGVIYATKTAIRADLKVNRITDSIIQRVKKVFKTEIQVYNQYLRGQVYGYLIKDDKGNPLDSCIGFYDEKHLKEDARSSAKHYLEKLAGPHDQLPLPGFEIATA